MFFPAFILCVVATIISIFLFLPSFLTQRKEVVVDTRYVDVFFLTCERRKIFDFRYVQRDSFGETLHEPSILLGINVVIHEWPTPAQEEFVEGEQAVLSVPLKLYPKPENNEVTWKITDTKGQVTSLNPGKLNLYVPYYLFTLMQFWLSFTNQKRLFFATSFLGL